MRRLILAGAAALALAGFAPVPLGKAIFAGADPAVLVDRGRFWLYPTDTGDALYAWGSDDLAAWKKTEAPLIRLKDIAWIRDGAARHYLWAPHMLATDGKYLLYYSVGPQNPTPSRLGVATCTTPAGPCTDSGKPLLTGGQGFEAIDPMVFADPKSKKTYLYAGGSAGAKLRVWELNPDLVTLGAEATVDTPTGFTEGAWMHYRNGLYYLSYSAGKWNDASYSVHYAIALSPTGPWKYAGPILVGDKTYKGPGHHGFFQDPRDGAWYIAYHRWEYAMGNGPYSGPRKVALARVGYTAAGLIEPIAMGR